LSKTSSQSKNKYNAKAYDRITVCVPKGEKAQIQEHAQKREESLSGFIKRAIKHEMERDNQEDNK